MAYYDKEYELRDSQSADYVRKNGPDIYKEHTEKHLRNALNFAKGCGGSEARARREEIQREMRRRGIY